MTAPTLPLLADVVAPRSSRRGIRAIRLAIDLGILTASWLLAFCLRFDWILPPVVLRDFFLTAPYVVALQYGCLALLRVPRFSWRFVGLHEVRAISTALGIAAALLLIVRIATPGLIEIVADVVGVRRFPLLPLGVLFIDFALAALGMIGVRTLLRMQTERSGLDRALRQKPRTRTILIGAGRAGHMIAREVVANPQLGIEPVAFVDDDPAKAGMIVCGIKVVGTTHEIAAIASRYDADQALITLASAHGAAVRRILSLCNDAGIKTKIIPSLREIASGEVPISKIRDVAIEDLLRRDPIDLDDEQWLPMVRNKVVLVTGAGGSIGSELCRQVLRGGPSKLILLEQSENGLFWIHRELCARESATELVPCIADVCDEARIREVFATYRPAAVFHAAAHKHVPMMEANPGEAIKNNAGGTRVVVDAAHDYGVARFVMISTDKAVNPTSVMGATKRIAELYVQARAQSSKTKMVCVRFGNVLGSAGSVIPTFRDQIARGGPVTVTDPEMQRYFMTIPEACQLVLHAGGIGEGGEIFVLDMGEPVKIVDLAKQMIRLSGLRPGIDIELRFTGLRPGEKLFEELSIDGEENLPTRCPKVFVWKSQPRDYAGIRDELAGLVDFAGFGSPGDLREGIARLVPEYSVPVADRVPAGGLLGDKRASLLRSQTA